MVDYAEVVAPYLNTNKKLDTKIESLWRHWERGTGLSEAVRDFLSATVISPNIGRPEHYVPHCLQVSRRCEEVCRQIVKNYPFLKDFLDPLKLAFMGLIEDSFYLIGGNGETNPNKIDSNPFHEILTYAQFAHMGYDNLAEGMALHFVAYEILKGAHKNEEFLEVPLSEQPNLTLDILTVVDALCVRDFLPETMGNFENSLKYRIDDLRERRAEGHPLIKALNKGGQDRLYNLTRRVESLIRGNFSEVDVKKIYNL